MIIEAQRFLIQMGIRLRILISLGLADLAMTMVMHLAVQVWMSLGPFIQMST